jgi:uncharacterized protein with GYD domain
MPKYLVQASYTREGVKGVIEKGGSNRREIVEKTVEGLGGTVEAFYFGFGDADAHVIVELPDNVSAAAIALVVNAAGGAAAKTTVLLTPEEVDEAAKKSVDYTPPGA